MWKQCKLAYVAMQLSSPRSGDDAQFEVLSERQRIIVDIVNSNGFATIEALSGEFGVSAQTIRRDIISLDRVQLLRRFHGGAGARDAAVRFGYDSKRAMNVNAKRRIGIAAAAHVVAGERVFIDVGTTCEAVARALATRSELTVITPSMRVALTLCESAGICVVVPGGTVHGGDGSIAGGETVSQITSWRCSAAFIACSGFDIDGSPMDFDSEKVAVKRAIIQAARRRILVADASKFDRRAVRVICPLSAIDLLVTDAAPGARLGGATAAGATLQVEVAGPEGANPSR